MVENQPTLGLSLAAMTFVTVLRENGADTLFEELDVLGFLCREHVQAGGCHQLQKQQLGDQPKRLCHDKSFLQTRAAASTHHPPTSGNRLCGSRIDGDMTVSAPTGR